MRRSTGANATGNILVVMKKNNFTTRIMAYLAENKKFISKLLLIMIFVGLIVDRLNYNDKIYFLDTKKKSEIDRVNTEYDETLKRLEEEYQGELDLAAEPSKEYTAYENQRLGLKAEIEKIEDSYNSIDDVIEKFRIAMENRLDLSDKDRYEKQYEEIKQFCDNAKGISGDIFKCWRCQEHFVRKKCKACSKCGWNVCPNCGACDSYGCDNYNKGTRRDGIVSVEAAMLKLSEADELWNAYGRVQHLLLTINEKYYSANVPNLNRVIEDLSGVADHLSGPSDLSGVADNMSGSSYTMMLEEDTKYQELKSRLEDVEIKLSEIESAKAKLIEDIDIRYDDKKDKVDADYQCEVEKIENSYADELRLYEKNIFSRRPFLMIAIVLNTIFWGTIVQKKASTH